MRQNYSFSKNGNALLEPCEGKLSCTVLRGESPSNGADLLDRDQDVNPLLWEIRRERRVELMGEGTRLDDLRRWKKGHYVNKQPTGVYLKDASEFNVKVMNGPSNNEGYVYYFEKPIGWLEHYYLNPIPLNQLALNPALEQNPGWENNK